MVSWLKKRIQDLNFKLNLMIEIILSLNLILHKLNLMKETAKRTLTQLQSLLSTCGDKEVNDKIKDLTLALTNEIQRQQSCLQTINQLNSENNVLTIFKDLLVELNDKYPKVLSSFVYELQLPGNQASLPEINNWAKEQLGKINQNEIRSLVQFK